MVKLRVVSAGHLIGDRVKNPEGEYLGRIEDLIADLDTGRILYAVLSFSELLGIEDRLFAIPWEALTPAAEEKAFILNVSKQRLRNAPAFDAHHWPDLADPRWASEIHSYYGYEPHWESGVGAPVAGRHVDSPRRRGYVAPSRTSSGGWVLALILALVVIGLLAYLASTGSVETRETLQNAAVAVKEKSEDAATSLRVKTALALSKNISAFDINVDTRDGVVTLEGKVPSEGAKNLAVMIAENTHGVKSVRDDLTVSETARANPEREHLAARVADLELQVMVKDALRRNPALQGQAVEVEAQAGIVTLTGTVNDPTEKATAEQIARSVRGVEEVRNEIRVTPT